MNSLSFYWLIVPNLLLAWIPLLASLYVCRSLRDGRRPGIAAASLAVVWLAFYPNASYIVTDLKHLSYISTERTLYYDLSVNMLAAVLGWLLGALSLYGIHAEVKRRAGAVAGGLFAGAVTVLGAIGVYLGRVLRWNSWDLLRKPGRIVTDVLHIAADPQALLFIAAFSAMTGTLYFVLYRLADKSGLYFAKQVHYNDR